MKSAFQLPVFLVIVCLSLVGMASNAGAATPADQNFDAATGPGISSRIIGDWQFRLLDINGEDDNGGYDFVDVIDSFETNVTALASGPDNALSLIGTTNIAVAAQIRSVGSEPFSLVSFAIDGDDQTYLVTGYLGGIAVPGAVQSFFAPFFVETVVTLTNSLFQNIDEFRISRQDAAADIYVFIDDINVSAAVSASAGPVISALSGDSSTYVEGSPPVRLDTGTAAGITDSDSPDFHGGAIVVSIVGGRVPPQDVLGIQNQGTAAGQVGVTGNQITYGGVLVATFTGGSGYDDLVIALNNNASKTAARDIVRRLTYQNISTTVPVDGGRSISIRVYDGDGGYGGVTVSVTVQLNNFPPVVSTTAGTNSFLEGINETSVPVPVDAGLTLADPDDTTLAGATVRITGNFSSAEDFLLFTNLPASMGNIAGAYDTNSGVLTLASAGATATLAQWTAALRSVTYWNSSETPGTLNRTIRFVVDDGSDVSAEASKIMSVSAYNDAPVNSVPTGLLYLIVNTPLVFSSTNGNAVSIFDADAGTSSVQVSLVTSNGALSLATVDGLSFLTGDGTNDEAITVTGSQSSLNAALNGLVFTPQSAYTGQVEIAVFTSDLGNSGPGGFLVDGDSIFISVNATNLDAPVFTRITQDTAAPGDLVTADGTLFLHGTSQPNAIITLTRTGIGVIGSTNADATGEWTFDYTGTTLPDGTHSFTAVAGDPAGNTSPVSPVFTVTVARAFGIQLLSTSAVYRQGQPAVKLDTSAVLVPGERAHFGGGRLSVQVISNATAGDTLHVYNRGFGSNQIGVAANTVSFGALPFGTVVLQTNAAAPLHFDLTTNATPAAVQALLRELAFATTNASTTPREIAVTLADGLGSTTAPARKTVLINRGPGDYAATNLFPEFLGSFNGLVFQTNNILPAQSGYFLIKINPRLAYSGALTIGGRRVSISGKFNTNGHVATFTSGQKWGVELQLVPGTDQIRGRVTSYQDGGWTSDLVGYRQGFSKTNSAGALARSYTLRLPDSTDPDVALLGHGHASATVDVTGRVRLKGLLADGQAWSSSALLSTNGHWPLYAPLDRRLGALIGWLRLTTAPSNAITGTLTWIKPPLAPLATNGIAAELDANGSRYAAPSATNNILAWTNGVLRLSAGNLPSALTNNVNITPLGKFADRGGSITNLKFSLSPRTGLFTGSFLSPATARTAKFYGGLLQDRNDGAGFFIGTNQGGTLRLDPAP